MVFSMVYIIINLKFYRLSLQLETIIGILDFAGMMAPLNPTETEVLAN